MQSILLENKIDEEKSSQIDETKIAELINNKKIPSAF